MFLFFLFVLHTLWKNDILVVEVPRCSVSFRSYVLCLPPPLFLSTFLASSPMYPFSSPTPSHFLPLPSHLFVFLLFFFLCFTDSQALTQTSVLLMTCSVFLTTPVLASGLFSLHRSQVSLSLSRTHTVGLIPAGIGGLVRPLLSPRWLLAVISHSRAGTPSIMEAKLPSWLWPITHSTPVNSGPRHYI